MSVMTDNEIKAGTRRQMVVFFIIDTSGSMKGTKIGSVNAAILDVIPEVKINMAKEEGVDLKIAVLEFSSGCKWQDPSGPVSIDEFVWSKLSAEGFTDLGAALRELNSKLSKDGFLKAAKASLESAIILMSDGIPTDNWEVSLEALKENERFKNAIKAAVAIGDDAKDPILEQFTGNKESVLRVNNPTALIKMIKAVTVAASDIGSKSQPLQNGGVGTKQKAFNVEVQNIIQNDPDLKTPNVTDGW